MGGSDKIPPKPIFIMNRDDVINKVFPHSLFGYDPVAVDAFLDEVIREFDRLNNTIDVLKLKLSMELSEAQEVNRMLSSVMLKEGFLKRADELGPVKNDQREELPAEQTEPEAQPVPEDEPAEEPAETEQEPEPEKEEQGTVLPR